MEKEEKVEEAGYRLPNHPLLKPVEDLEPYTLSAEQNKIPFCLRCRASFTCATSAMMHYPVARELRLGVCPHCFREVVCTGTIEGRRAVEEYLDCVIPPRYRYFEFSDFDIYSSHIQEVCSAVNEWCEAVRGNKPIGSLYIYSEPGSWGSGCGNGKSTLLWWALKRIIRFCSRLKPYEPCNDLQELDNTSVDPIAFGCDLGADLVTPWIDANYKLELVRKTKFELFTLGVPNPPTLSTPKDIAVSILGVIPVLFLDDVGQDKPDGIASQLYGTIFDVRANQQRPMFITSNFSVAALGKRIGDRAVSRLMRTNCKVIEIRAQDYSLLNRAKRSDQ